MVVKNNWLHILITFAGGIVALAMTENTIWINAQQGLLSGIAIISVGVLMRLARGVPFSAIDVLTKEEAHKLSCAIKQSVRTLQALLAVCFLTVFLLIFVDDFPYATSLIPFFLVFIIIRTFSVTLGDIEIVDIQANILTKTYNKKRSDDFQKSIAGQSDTYKTPPSYGGTIDKKEKRKGSS